MAVGIGAMLGIDIPVNFDSPYKSRNIIEFWKRWHISLNRFLTKNVYIPLGGNRKGTVRTYVNLLLVFLISGIWHGAGVTFIIWGLMHGLLYVITRLIRNKFPQSCEGIFSQIFTFIYVCLAWVFFRADTVSDACKVIGGVFTGSFALPSKAFAEGFNLKEFWYVFKVLHIDRLPVATYLLMIIFTVYALITVFALPNALTVTKQSRINAKTGILCGVLLLWCILSLSGVSAFLYFNF
jgi:D-alanyl-lipoteichoic acid acyltransferase DltB (MBOAT superfamily)